MKAIFFALLFFAFSIFAGWEISYPIRDSQNAFDVIQTNDGGYLAVGNGIGPCGSPDFFALRTDSDGAVLWTWSLPSSACEFDGAFEAIPYLDSLYLVVGELLFNATVVALSDFCDTVWTKTYPILGSSIHSVVANNDGGFTFAGKANIGGAIPDVLVFRVDSEMNIIWQKNYGGADSDEGMKILKRDDLYFVLGYTRSFGVGEADGWLLCLDSLGDSLWTRTIGSSASDYFISGALSDGIISVGTTCSPTFLTDDIWIVRFNFDGDTIWTHAIGNALNDASSAIVPIREDGFVISGIKENNIPFLMKFNPSGGLVWEREFSFDCQNVFGLSGTRDNGFILAGSVGPGEDTDFLLVKTNRDGLSPINEGSILSDTSLYLNVKPNPFNSSCIISKNFPNGFRYINIFNLSGRLIEQLSFPSGNPNTTWNPGKSVGSGVYLIEASSGNSVYRTRIALIR